MNTTEIATTVILLAVNAAFAIALDRAPSRGYGMSAPLPGEDGLYPITEPSTGWRRYWRPVCLIGTIATATALGIIPILSAWRITIS